MTGIIRRRKPFKVFHYHESEASTIFKKDVEQ